MLSGPGGGTLLSVRRACSAGRSGPTPSLVLDATSLDLTGLTERARPRPAGGRGPGRRAGPAAISRSPIRRAPSCAPSSARARPDRPGSRRYLLLGSVGPDLYDEADAELLSRVAALIAPHVALLVEQAARERESRGRQPPQPVAAARDQRSPGARCRARAKRPAGWPSWPAGFLPFDELHFALRLSEGDRVVLLDPGERRPLPDLASVPVAGTALGAVLQGEPSALLRARSGRGPTHRAAPGRGAGPRRAGADGRAAGRTQPGPRGARSATGRRDRAPPRAAPARGDAASAVPAGVEANAAGLEIRAQRASRSFFPDPARRSCSG